MPRNQEEAQLASFLNLTDEEYDKQREYINSTLIATMFIFNMRMANLMKNITYELSQIADDILNRITDFKDDGKT